MHANEWAALPRKDVFERAADHEQVVFGHDQATGLKAIVALYSTALGPAIGGTRFYPYASEDAAIDDVLNLARGMAYKTALARLPLGGGKAVIIGDPATDKTPELMAAYGRFVDSLNGRYVTACDVGTDTADMDVIATQTEFVTGRSTASGGAGDPSPHTAVGVMQSMRAAAAHRWGSPMLAGKRVGVSGVGKVGHRLVGHLVDAGASVMITDARSDAVAALRQRHPEVDVAPDTETLMAADLDVFAPCALGGVLNDETVGLLSAEIVCGAANGQLAHPDIADDLQARGVLYVPDYLVNAGGVIHVSDELQGYDRERVRERTDHIFETTATVLALAAAEAVTPPAAADRIAAQRMSAAQAARSGRKPSNARAVSFRQGQAA